MTDATIAPSPPTALETAARHWMTGLHRDKVHLARSLDWLLILDPAADEATRLAALLHDMERAYPGPDLHPYDGRRGPADPEHNRRHSERSARIVGDWLHGRGASPALVAHVAALIRAHEDGGWYEADLVQAADSLSFLETNVDLFLSWVPAGTNHVGLPEVRAKLDYSLDRIRLSAALPSARQLHQTAHRRVDDWAREHADAADRSVVSAAVDREARP